MKKKILASAPTKEGLEKLINEYFYSTNYIIKDDRPYSTKSGYAPDRFKDAKTTAKCYRENISYPVRVTKHREKKEA